MAEETKTKAVTVVTGNSMLTDTGRFEHSYRVAKMFSGSQLVPKHLQGKVEDVMIALSIADRLGEDPLTIMQSIYIVSGKAGWSSSYMIARINQSGKIKGRITWDVSGTGKELSVTAKATLADTGEVVTATATMQMAIAEGWVSNKKYQSMPEQMLRFRSAAMLQRLYFPEVMLGMRTAEELEDTGETAPAMREINPQRGSAASSLAAFAGTAPVTVDTPPEMVVASDVPEDGPNVFPADDPAAVAALKERTGVSKEDTPSAPNEVIDGDTGEVFDADEYLTHVLKVLKTMSPDEIAGANAEVKKHLANHPQHLGQWQSARFTRLKEITEEAGRKGGGGRATR